MLDKLSLSGAASAAISDAHPGGALLSTNAGAAGNHHFYQRAKISTGDDTSATFLFQKGKQAWFKARFKVSDADKNIVFAGLHITNTDPVAAAPTDGIYFHAMSYQDLIIKLATKYRDTHRDYIDYITGRYL